MKTIALGVFTLLLSARMTTAQDRVTGDEAVADKTTTPDTSPDQSPLELRLRLKLGMRFRTRASIDEKGTSIVSFGKSAIPPDMRMMPSRREITRKTTLILDSRVLSVDEAGNSIIRIFFSAVQMDTNVSGAHMLFDSTKAVPERLKISGGSRNGSFDPSSLFLCALAGESYTTTSSLDGSTVSISGLDIMVKHMASKAGIPFGAPPDFLHKMLVELLERGSRFPGPNLSFPAKSIAIGESWTKSTRLSGGIVPRQINFAYTLKSRQQGTATLDAKVNFSSLTTGGKLPFPALAYTRSGVSDSTITVDEATGWIRSSSGELQSVTKIDIKHGISQSSPIMHVTAYGRTIEHLETMGN